MMNDQLTRGYKMSHLNELSLIYSPVPFISSSIITSHSSPQNQSLQQQQQQQPPSQAQITVLALEELRIHIANYLELYHIATCCLVSRQWYQDWISICWRHIHHREPKHFKRHGHLIRTMNVRVSSKFNPYQGIRDYCLNLSSLKIVDFRLEPTVFEETTLSIKPGLLLPPLRSSEGGDRQIQNQVNRIFPIPSLPIQLSLANSPFIDAGPGNGFLSNNLESLELHVPPAVCEIVLPWIIQARMAGRLQNLQHFVMGTAITYLLCIDLPIIKTHYSNFSDIVTILHEFPRMKTFSTSDMDIAKDKGANEIVQDESYQLHTLGIKPASSSMFETLVSRMPYLINLSLLFVGTVKLFPSVQQFCPNLTSLIVDMEAQTYPHDSIAEDDPDLHIKFADWIDLFNTLTKLERFEGRSVSLPTVVLKALADSCPNLRYFKTCSDSTVSAFGASYLLSHCHSLTDMILNQMYFLCLFNGDEPWRAPIENLVLDAVVFKASEENDVFRERMRQLPYLRSLSIYYTGDMTIRALIDPAEKYNFVPSAIPRNVKSIPKVPFLRLELLNLGYFSESSPESFAKIASCMPRLESLSLGSVKKTYDRKTKSNLIITN